MVADSAEVEILIMEKSQMGLFPEDVQLEVVSELLRAPSVERPFTDKVMGGQQAKFAEWFRQRKVTMKRALQGTLPGDMRAEMERQSAPRAQDDMSRFIRAENAESS